MFHTKYTKIVFLDKLRGFIYMTINVQQLTTLYQLYLVDCLDDMQR